MGLSIRGYARHHGVTPAAVRKALKAGRISLGPDGTIDAAAADRAWAAATAPRMPGVTAAPGDGGNGGGRAGDGAASGAATVLGAHTFYQARTATMLAEAQLRRLRLEERRGQLLDRQAALARVFAFVRGMRDAWLAWPARVGAELAAELGVDAVRVQIALDAYVRRQLEELADAQLDLGTPRRGA